MDVQPFLEALAAFAELADWLPVALGLIALVVLLDLAAGRG